MAPKDMGNPHADYTVQQMYDFLLSHTLRRDPGAMYEYSNLGMGLLGHALARRAGTDYETLAINRVLKPLGMKDTRITLNASLQKRLAPGHSSLSCRDDRQSGAGRRRPAARSSAECAADGVHGRQERQSGDAG